MRKLFIIFSLISNATAQIPAAADYNPLKIDSSSSVYIGEVVGAAKNEFLKLEKDYGFMLAGITKSQHVIEIRFYSINPTLEKICCIELYFDTVFKIQRSIQIFNKNKKSVVKDEPNVDVNLLYDKLINSGIFSLKKTTEETVITVFKNGKLRTKKFIVPVLSGRNEYYLEYKVGDLYNFVLIDQPKIVSELYPDNQLYRRYNEIISIFKNVCEQ